MIHPKMFQGMPGYATGKDMPTSVELLQANGYTASEWRDPFGQRCFGGQIVNGWLNVSYGQMTRIWTMPDADILEGQVR